MAKKNVFLTSKKISFFTRKWVFIIFVWLLRTSSEKFDCRTIRIRWESYKKLKIEEFLHMWLFIFDIRTLNFTICQKNTFAVVSVGQASSRWINSNYVGKVSIWRCQVVLTLSGLYFLFSVNPWILNRGLPNPHRKMNGHFAPMCTGQSVRLHWSP